MASALARQLVAAIERRQGSGSCVSPREAAAASAERLADWGVERAVMADDPLLDMLGIPDAVAAIGVEVLRWPTGRPVAELLGIEGPTVTCGITVPVSAAADRGTLMLAAAAGQGRAIDAASTYHLAVLHRDRLRGTLLEALADVYRSGEPPPSALTMVSGPSRTSDIEKISTLGAHGAVGLHAMVVCGEESPEH